MSATRPYVVLDDDDDYDGSGSDVELLDYDSNPEPEIIAMSSRSTSSTATNKRAKNDDICLPDITLQRYTLSKGNIVRLGDTVELRDCSSQNAMHSGDFLRIKFIIKDMETGQVRFRGYRMRRTKYLKQIFDWKLNELAMVLQVDEDDDRCPFVAGMEDVGVDEVLQVRECTLTNKAYPLMSFRTAGRITYPRGMSRKEIKQQIFQGGRLCCRVVNILILRRSTGKSYAGVVRHLYPFEADTPNPDRSTENPDRSSENPNRSSENSDRSSEIGSSREASIYIEDNEEDECVIISNGPGPSRKRRARSDSIEILEAAPPKRKSPHPMKEGRFTFGDVFCGAGGASQGAAQAGYYVQWGLDNEEAVLQSYRKNHCTAHVFRCDAHKFPPSVCKDLLGVDVLHLSPPCCFWSPAHTSEGRNDQANYEAIYTVGPILKKVKPRIATLEQTFGLVTHTQHNRNFLMLLNDISRAGYDVRYKVEDLSKYGLVQQRKRLLMIAARRGTPLPSFPKPTHGAPGSDLQPFFCIKDALAPLEHQARRIRDDPYHLPKSFPVPKPAYNPRSFLKGCITTSGSESYHYSGTRSWTPRELSLFQSFPYAYDFVGTTTEVKKQIGNAFPPIMAEAMYRVIGKTLQAFDDGLITVEDDLSDLDALLQERKAAHTPIQSAPQRLIRSHRRANPATARPMTESPSAPSSSRAGNTFPSMNLFEGVLDGINQFPQRAAAAAASSGSKRVRRAIVIEDDDSSIINLLSDSDN